jgi:transforming growth factor-beta-induced protein
LGTQVASSAITNGAIVNPLSTTNSLKLTLKANGEVFVNQAKVTTADVTASNGTVHAVDAVLLPVETVADVAIDNGFSTLVTAVIQQELLPALTNPLATYTVFAPTNAAFDNLATALNTDIAGLLALPNLTNILLYHVLDVKVLSSNLTNGFVQTLSGQNVLVDLSSGVKINDSNVITADVLADNGVVHVIDKVLIPTSVSVEESLTSPELNIYPNPTSHFLSVGTQFDGSFEIFDFYGKKIISGNLKNQIIDVTSLPSGNYLIRLIENNKVSQNKFVKL